MDRADDYIVKIVVKFSLHIMDWRMANRTMFKKSRKIIKII